MRACRLFCLLLALMLALPFGAFATQTQTIEDIIIRFGAYDESIGTTTEITADRYADYDWGAVEGQSGHIWIMLLSERIPAFGARVSVWINDGFGPAEYTLYDAMRQTEMIDLSASDFALQTNSYQLMQGGQMTAQTLDVTPSTHAVSQADISGGQGGWDSLPEENLDEGLGDDAWTQPVDNGVSGGLPEEPLDNNVWNAGDDWTDPAAGNTWDDTYGDDENSVDSDFIQGAPLTAGLLSAASQGEQYPVIEPENVEKKTMQELPDETQLQSHYAYVTEDETPVYISPAEGSVPLATMGKEAVVEMFANNQFFSQVNPDTGEAWISVEWKDALGNVNQGYIRHDFIRFMTADEAALHEREINPPMEELAAHESDYGILTEAGATLRLLSGGETTLSAGEYVRYESGQSQRNEHDASGDLWLVVTEQKNGRTGLLRQKSMQFLTRAEAQTYEDSLLPDAQQMPSHPNNYARVAASSASLYTADKGVINPLAKDAVVIYRTSISTFVDKGTGKLYIPVTVDDGSGNTGYVMLDDIAFMSDADKDRWEASKIPEAPAPEMPASPRLAWVLVSDLQVRPNPNSAPQYRVQKDDVVRVTDLTQDTKGDYWYYVEIVTSSANVGKMGYVTASSDYLQIMSEREEQLYLESQKEPEVVKPPLAQKSGYMRVNTNYATLVAWPDIGGSILGVLNYRDVVYVDSQVYDASNNVWSLAQPLTTGASWGYIQDQYLTAMSVSEVSEYFATPRPTPVSVPTYSPTVFSGYAVLTTNRVNFRTSASSANNNNVIRQLSQGTIVRVISETTSGGYTWYYCESNGTNGYLRNDVMALLTVREYQQLASQPSYDKNGSIITPTATANLNAPGVSTWATPRPGATSTITFVTIPPLTAGTPGETGDPQASGSPDPDASQSPDPSASDIAGMITASPDPFATLPPLEEEPEFPTQGSSGFSVSSLLIALGVLAVLGGGGFYGYSIYNRNRKKMAEEEARLEMEEARKAALKNANEQQAAVRRPPVPTVPTAQTGKPATAQQRPPTGTGAAGAGSSVAAGGRNPYERPQGQGTPPTQTAAGQRVQEVRSTQPRAQVDGRPVGADPQSQYGRPAGQAGAQAAGQGTQAATPPNQGQSVPIAPPPVTPDAQATASEADDALAPRRRRRRQALDGTPEGTTQDTTKNPTDKP